MNERLEQYIRQLSPDLQTYAREYLEYMHGKGPYPQPGKTLGDRDAQQVRIRLAQLG